jgi:hypothetical protein
MRYSRRSITAALLTLGVFLMAVTASASAASGGTLTTAEYQELTASVQITNALKGTLTEKKVTTLFRACSTMAKISPLVDAEKSACNYALDALGADVEASSAEKKCGKIKAENGRFACLVSPFRVAFESWEDFYRAEKQVDHLVATRGFTGKCAAALSEPAKAIADEHLVATATGKMLSALHARSASDLTEWAGRLITDSGQLDAALKNIPTSLTPCAVQQS